MDRITIGEAAARSGLPPKTIRFYEEAGVISPATREDNGYRSYGEDDVRTLRFIHRARGLGFSLKDIGDLLALHRDNHRASREVKDLALRHVAEINRKIAEMAAMRDAIAKLAEQCHGDQQPECSILDALEAPDR